MEGECSYKRSGQFNGQRMIMLGGQFNGGRMVMLQKLPVPWRENGHVTEVVTLIGENSHVREVVSLMEREWSCYGGGQFNGGRMIVRELFSFMEGEWSFYRGAQFNGGRMVIL